MPTDAAGSLSDRTQIDDTGTISTPRELRSRSVRQKDLTFASPILPDHESWLNYPDQINLLDTN